MRNIKHKIILLILFLVINYSSFAFGIQPPDSAETNQSIYDGKVQLTFGLFLPSINSSAQLNTKSGGLGTIINLEAAFKLPETQQLFRFNGLYRFNNHHSVEGYYYALNRSGSNIALDSIAFGNLIININSSFTSFFRTTLFGGKYRYSVYNDEKVEAGFSIGVSFLALDIGASAVLLNKELGEEEYADLLFLPVFGFNNRVNLSDNLIFRSNVDAFALDIKRYNGVLFDLSVALEYRFLENLSAGLSYNAFSLDVKFDTKEKGEIKYNYKGFMFYGKIYF
jgi:hypothetical protein